MSDAYISYRALSEMRREERRRITGGSRASDKSMNRDLRSHDRDFE